MTDLRTRVLAFAVLFVPFVATNDLTAQDPSKRAVTHDDYDKWPSIRSATYSNDGKWMSYGVKPRVGDGVLYIREVDGEKVYTFDRGERVTFSNDNKRAFFKIGKSYADERKKKLEKLHEKKEEKAGEEEEEEAEGLPPDVKEALAERGMTERMALRMIEQRGASIAEVRGFLGLPEPKKKGGGGKAPQEKKKEKKEDPAEKERKALAKRLHVLDLSTGEVTKVERVKSYRQPKDSNLLAIHFEKPEAKKDKDEKKDKDADEKKGEKEKVGEKEKKEAGKEKAAEKKGTEKKGTEKVGAEKEGAEKPKKKVDKKEKKRSDGTKLVLRDLDANKDVTIEHVRSFGFLADGKWMWYTVGTKKMKEGVEHGLFARDLASGRTVTVLAGYSNTSGMTADEDDNRLAFTSDLATFGEKETERDVYVWDFSDQAAIKVVTKDTAGIPEDYRIRSTGLGFSRDGSVLTFGVRPPKKKDLPKILSEDEIKLDLWHWQDGLLQTMQAKRSDPSEATLTAVYHPDMDRAVVLGRPKTPRVSLLTDDGSRALVSDSTPYEQQVTWDGRYNDYYIVNTIDGSRRKIIEGLRGSASRSTGGRYVIWFDHRDYDWHVYDLRTSTTRNLTENLAVAFDREIDDRPEPHRAHGTAGWTEGDAEVLIHDEFDVWAINPETGAFRCVTDGLGRATNTTFRVTRVDLRPDAQRDDNEERRFLEGPLVLKATNKDTYAQGYYVDSLHDIGRPRKLVMKDCSIGNPTRPRDADRLFLTYSRFDQFPDLWTTDLSFASPRKLTDACPLLADLRWGKAEVVNWQSDDGELQGYLIKPDGFDPARKYPMMVYFYEKSSSRVHSFVSPNCGTSPNAAYYVSNGYLWFVPDIHYTDGFPGESCEKCVVSGVQHVVSMGFVDKDSIGAAGHSWGGYQTAHLITRTNIFACVESGAPVVNMFSAYGGIRWGSGMSRQFQYEQTQSRIGGSIWDYPMRYWENSPLFHLDKVKTPVLILHNDKDGAVPWYQGIEFFVAMRRLGKEAYMFNYNNEDHGLRKRQNQRDWTRRMQEYFDHHLRGAPAPEWMKSGVPYHERMAEKIPNAPSYLEALDAGLIKPEGEEKKKPAAKPVEAGIGGGNQR